MLYFWREISDLAPNYDDCGNVCGETDELRRGFCDDCPIKLAEAEFIDNLTEQLDKRCPNDWRQFSIESLRQTVVEVMRLEKSNAELTITSDVLINIVNSERNKMERIDRYNAEQRRRTPGD